MTGRRRGNRWGDENDLPPGYVALIDRLKQRRLKLGMTQAGVAHAMGCNRTLVAKWDGRELRLDILHFARLCGVHQIDGRTLLRLLKDPP
jgi:transcriptional regulator with XRE-family HTH domain